MQDGTGFRGVRDLVEEAAGELGLRGDADGADLGWKEPGTRCCSQSRGR